MTFAPDLRQFTFTTHVTSSVAWAGAVLVFLALAVIGLTSDDEATVRGAYLVMAPAAWFVLVPLAHASLLTGIALSLGTSWGLFRHYWVVIKLLITAFSTAILMIYMGTFRQMAGVAADPIVEFGLIRNPSPALHALLALVLLLIATALGVYKPFGMTPYGRRKVEDQRRTDPQSLQAAVRRNRVRQRPWSIYIAGIVAVALILLFLILHLTGTIAVRH